MVVTAICHILQWSPFLVICFDVFFALAHKPFWSILHPNTFKTHLQLKLQEIQWKTKVTQTKEWMAVAQKMTLSPPKNITNSLPSTRVKKTNLVWLLSLPMKPRDRVNSFIDNEADLTGRDVLLLALSNWSILFTSYYFLLSSLPPPSPETGDNRMAFLKSVNES